MKHNVGDLMQVKVRDSLPKECVDCTGIVTNNNRLFTFYCPFLRSSSSNNNCCSCMKEDNTLVISQVK